MPEPSKSTTVASDHLLWDILANAPDGIITTDLKGRITTASASVKTLLGYDPVALEGTPVHRIYPAGRETADHLMEALKQDGSIRARELKLKRQDGTLLDISLSVALLKDDSGNPSGTLGIFRDISELKALSQQVFQAERMAAVATLAGGIAHNFNNLLMSVQGYTSLMLMDVSEKHRHFGMLQKIETQIAAGARLTQKLMGFAREGEYTVKAVNLNNLIADVTERFQVSRGNILMQNQLDEKSPAVTADRAQLEEALLNLFMNAADAMPKGGMITCRTRMLSHTDIEGRAYAVKPGTYVQLTVSDTGHGIAAEHLPFIFEPFYSTKDISQGAGLGLASAYGIVKAHGGFIDVASTQGAGAVFDILLPTQALVAAPETPIRDRVTRGSETVLVVDDDDIVLEVAAKMLSALGYQTLTASTVAAALAVYADHAGAVDLVLLDLTLEEADGAVVFYGIRDIDATARVLLASGRSLDDNVRELLNAGASGFIQKPFGLRDLSAAVRKILDNDPI
ncbi:MAG: ATP-binding protein [Pseudomonadota bacterium]